MALAGAMIVFAGLIILSYTIAQLPKLLKVFEKGLAAYRKNRGTPRKSAVETSAVQPPSLFPTEAREIARLYQVLIDDLGQPFRLQDLYASARQKGYPHPHLSISKLRQAQIMMTQDAERFTWQKP